MDKSGSIYGEEARQIGRLAFSMWNRDPGSPSFGSFDRMYWGWKYKDFSDATLQYAVRLAVEYARHEGKTSTLPALLDQFAFYCASIQHRDGSFDQCYPNEKSPGVLFDFLSSLVYVRTSPFLESEAAQQSLDAVMRRGVAFLLRTDETHARVANHTAQYAFELLNYAAHSGDEHARQRGAAYLERTLAWFDTDEGWFWEYSRADTGYQTRTLRYLGKIALLTRSEPLWAVIRKSARFIEQTLAPDGSIHPMLGCRSSGLLYPSAFELLASHDPSFRTLAVSVRGAWRNRRVPLPSQLDFVNAIRLADDALDASLTASALPDDVQPGPSTTVLRNAGIIVHKTESLGVYLSASLGGTVVVYVKDGSQQWQLAYEDSGYLITSHGGKRRWLTRVPQAGNLVVCESDRFVIRAKFHRSSHEEMTPLRMIVLRILNLTLLKHQWLADLFRRLVVHRLMKSSEVLDAEFEREVALRDGKVLISDRVVCADNSALPNAALYRCRKVSGIHMASAGYFHEQDLDDTGMPWIARIPESFIPEYKNERVIAPLFARST